ncbi:MAG: hypothetical protein FK734_09395 [Asgard group archaeon]|nr:hypothetical protein [Asgard group archaeon]
MKTIKKLSFIFIATILISLQITQIISPYQVSSSESYDYKVKRSLINLHIGNEHYSGNAFKVGLKQYKPTKIITAAVTSLGGDNVLWTLSCESQSDSKLADWNLVDEVALSSLLINPMYTIEDFLLEPELADYGLGLLFYPFVGTQRTIDFFKAFENETQFQFSFFVPKVYDANYNASYQEIDTLVLFELIFTGVINETSISPQYTLTFTHQCQFVYDISIGVLYGSHILSSGSGLFQEQEVDYTFESYIELIDYSLPKLIFGDSTVIWWIYLLCALGGVSLISIPVILIIRRKK